MSVIARLEVIPVRERGMADAIANAVEAIESFDVSYETTPTDTVIEADDAEEVFAAAAAAHRAVGDERVITSLEVDDLRTRTQRRRDRVAAVERELGRPAKRERREETVGSVQRAESGQRGRSGQRASAGQRAGSGQQRGSEIEVRRYQGPVKSDPETRSTRSETSQSRPTTSRYLRVGR